MPTHYNLLIEAGAGTGKTTRLVKAVLEALFIREIPLDRLVALTFTNKAAGELKERVSLALEEVLEAPEREALRRLPWFNDLAFASFPLDHLKEVAQNAMGLLDRTDIATIHSFAYSLLKRFPIAAGINPDSEIDDKGLRFDELFRNSWPEWLAVELGAQAPRESAWLDLLSRMTLTEVEEAARHLADFKAPLDYLPLSDAQLPQRLEPFYLQARALAAEHGGSLNADKIAQACEEILGAAAKGAWEKLGAMDDETREILGKAQGSPKAWTEEDLETLGTLHLIAKNLLARGDRTIHLLTDLLKPFVVNFRNRLLSEGSLSHSALLFLSRELVRARPDIREQLKTEIRLILIDEFQDTDPLQAELLLYLAEVAGRSAETWETIQLEPGKLFIVGDPKQSIYRFRGADIAAYQQIGARVITQGGRQETLEVNYRSQAQIIDVVNTAFDKLILAVPNISPPYVAVQARHAHEPASWPIQDVELWVATNPAEAQTVEAAQDTEAEAVAQWITEHVGKKEIPVAIHPTNPTGKRMLAYRDIALIFRTYSPMDRFIEALRHRHIPFAVESERFFFSTPEVTDFLNLLHVIADPLDTLSWVGFLKGPLAAITDKEILELTLPSSSPNGSVGDPSPLVLTPMDPRLQSAGVPGPIKTLAKEILHWNALLTREPLTVILNDIFDSTFLLELAARSYHGDQTVANLLKLRRLLESLVAKGDRTMKDVLERLDEFFDDDKLEGESPLADESYDAVRILTIHKAKGLEFPVVFLPSLHSEIRTNRTDSFVFDWRKQQLGLEVGPGLSNLDKILLDREAKARDTAEQQRILYVAMTRAKQRLILSGGIDLRVNKSGTFLNRLASAWGFSLKESAEGKIAIGSSHLTFKRLPPIKVDRSKPHLASDKLIPPFDPANFATIWKQRTQARKHAEETALVVTATTRGWVAGERGGNSDEESTLFSRAVAPSRPLASSPGHAVVVGTLAHRFLELWDFQCKKCDMLARLRQIAAIFFSTQGLPEDTEVVNAVQRLLAGFIGSPDYAEIQASEILGREIPFFYASTLPSTSHSPPSILHRGTMDILYRRPDGKIVIGDYKTGTTPEQNFAQQAITYKEAVRLSTGQEAEFKLIYL